MRATIGRPIPALGPITCSLGVWYENFPLHLELQSAHESKEISRWQQSIPRQHLPGWIESVFVIPVVGYKVIARTFYSWR